MATRGRDAVRVTVASVTFVVAGFFVTVTTLPVSARQQAVVTASTAQAPALTLEAKEQFLKKARIVRTRGSGKGVTGTLRATLSDGVITHEASIQTVDEYMTSFTSRQGTELNFRDSWRYNVAAYRLDRLLDLGMIPPSVERNYNGKQGAFTWWVDDVLMDEGARLKDKASAPNPDAWNRQMWHVRLFDQWIYNVDRNLGNLLIDQSWTVWMIDHTRAFRLADKLKSPRSLTKCDRQVFEKLKTLDQATVKGAVESYLTGPEIKALLQRRDEIVSFLEKAGPTALIDRTQP